MRSYLNTKKKKKLIKILHLLPSNFRTKHFFIKRIIYDLFEIVSLSRHRGRIDRRRKVRTSMRNGMGSAMPIRIGVRSLRMLIGAINAANKSLRRRSSLASCRYSKIRPADNYSADGTIYWYIDSIPIVETRFLLFLRFVHRWNRAGLGFKSIRLDALLLRMNCVLNIRVWSIRPM